MISTREREMLHVGMEALSRHESGKCIRHREHHTMTLRRTKFLSGGILRRCGEIARPRPETESRRKSVHAVAIRSRTRLALLRPGFNLREEHRIAHRLGNLTALNGLRAFIRCVKLHIRPLVEQESGAVLRDAIAAHERDRLTHHIRAMTGVPELAARTEHVGDSHKVHVADGYIFVLLGILAFGEKLNGLIHRSLHRLEHGTALAELLLGFILNCLDLVIYARDVEAKRACCFGGCPHVRQTLRDVLLHLEAKRMARTSLVHANRTAETRTLIADDRLDCGHERCRTHHADTDARLGEDLRDDFGMGKIRNDDAILDRVSADDTGGGNNDVDHGIAGIGELMDELLRLCSTVELAGVGRFDDNHAGTLEAFITGIERDCDVVADLDVRDEASALLDAEHGLFAILPLGH